MAVVKAISSRASIGRAITYITKTEKTDSKLVSGIDCSPDTAIDEMKATKAVWGKEDGRQYQHFVHSFPPSENITQQEAHKMALELCAEHFKGHEILIATHKDTDHIHSHIIVNSVNYENGKKLHWKKQDLQDMKDKSNEMSRERGLSLPEKGQAIAAYKKEKYKVLEKSIEGNYKSYVLDCYKAVFAASQTAINKDDFITKMKSSGYETNWADRQKHITFTDIDGNKIRAANLERTFKEPFGKEALENGFERNLRTANEKSTIGSIQQSGNRLRDAAGNGITKLRATIKQSNAIAGTEERRTANYRVDRQDGNGKSNDTAAAIAKLRFTVGKSKSDIADDERKRADRIINEESHKHEPDRRREPAVQRRNREFPERNR